MTAYIISSDTTEVLARLPDVTSWLAVALLPLTSVSSSSDSLESLSE